MRITSDWDFFVLLVDGNKLSFNEYGTLLHVLVIQIFSETLNIK